LFKAKPIPDTTTWADNSPVPLEAVLALRQGNSVVSNAPDAAWEPFKKALALSPPDFAQPLEWLGMIELYHRDRPKARELFLQALEVDSFSVYALRYLTKLSHNDGDIEQALRYGKQLIRMAPHDPEGWMTVAWILSDQDKKEDAQKLLLQARETIGNHPNIIELIESLKTGKNKGG
jgi:tetratricopeptide (TPR) repeat protein